MNVEHDLLCLGPAGHALQIVARVADSDWELLRADRAKRRGPASLGDYDLLAGILPLDIIVGALERIEALIRLDPDRLLVAVRLRPVPDRIDVDADEIDGGRSCSARASERQKSDFCDVPTGIWGKSVFTCRRYCGRMPLSIICGSSLPTRMPATLPRAAAGFTKFS